MIEKIASLIHRTVVALSEDDSAYSAARAMCERDTGTVIITDGQGQFRGLLTDRDLVCSLVALDQSPDVKLKDLMTPGAVAVPESATVKEVVSLMKLHGVRRIPVVNELKNGKRHCVGIVSLDDLIVAHLVRHDDLSDIIKQQIFNRKALPRWRTTDVVSDPIATIYIRDLVRRTSMSQASALSLTELVAGLIVRRLHFENAAALIARLPNRLHPSFPMGGPRPNRARDWIHDAQGAASAAPFTFGPNRIFSSERMF